MDTQEAFSLLELPSSANKEELEASFRRLVMVYHPDKNPEKAAWSHEKMALLNEAHDIAARHIAAPRAAPPPEAPRPSREALMRLQKAFLAAREDLLDGMHLYYTFKLENVHLRGEGNSRFHYNSARRSIKRAVTRFLALTQENPESQGTLEARIALYGEFGKSFYAGMGIAKIWPADGSLNYKAYKHYKNSSLIIDALVRHVFFPEDFARPPDLSSKSIVLCEQELLLILSNYRDTVWVPEATVKLELLDNLRRLAVFENIW